MFLSAVLLFFTLAARAPGTEKLVQRLESRYHDAESLQAEFLERYSEGRRSAHIESGRVFFKRPGKMRWEYQAPEQKLFIADGKYVWFYVPSDRTVTRARTKESGDWRTPLGLLTGKAKLSRLCDALELVPRAPAQQPGHAMLRCTPRGVKPHAAAAARPSGSQSLEVPSDVDFEEIFLEVDEATGDLASVRVRQPGGIEIEYRFAKWQRNPALAESLFHFQAPIGVAIVDEGALSGRDRHQNPE